MAMVLCVPGNGAVLLRAPRRRPQPRRRRACAQASANGTARTSGGDGWVMDARSTPIDLRRRRLRLRGEGVRILRHATEGVMHLLAVCLGSTDQKVPDGLV